MAESGGVADFDPRDYYRTRYAPEAQRDQIWRHITSFLQRYLQITSDSCVLELGCGYASWTKAIPSSRRIVVDLYPDLPSVLVRQGLTDVTAHVGSCTDLSFLPDASIDVVLASNLLEHLSMGDVSRCLHEVHRVLKSNGLICLIQPNFRNSYREYFDDYTHQSIFTDTSLMDVLEAHRLTPQRVWPRFLPFSMKKRAYSRLAFLVPLYLRLPIKPMAGQLCVIATRGAPS